MKKASVFGAFNARWMTPAEVAHTFVPTPHIIQLVQTQHSLLMGPRGCGKTTLLKMLTREAQQYWSEVRVKREPALAREFPRPDFEAVYVPSDVRWFYELNAVRREIGDDLTSERVQRHMIALAAVAEATKVFEDILRRHPEALQALAMNLINHFGLTGLVPTLGHVRLKLMALEMELRDAIIRQDRSLLQTLMDGQPRPLGGHVTDALVAACSVFSETVPTKLRPHRWGLCFDEIEIAPPWLQRELLRALRSMGQAYVFKLTWSPVLPEDVRRDRQEQGDYAAIRIWHSHVLDARRFCAEFSRRLIRDKLGLPDITPTDVFGRSLFAAEERLGESDDVYAHGSEIWQSMVDLSQRDPSFRTFLIRHGLDPANPVSDSSKGRDECLRKIKPIVLIRETFRGAKRARSRKRPALYAGEEAIYDMSDGNPRWLGGLLNDLLDVGLRGSEAVARPLIPHSKQAPILSAASNRMGLYVKFYPTGDPVPGRPPAVALDTMVERLAAFFSDELLGPEFTDEPPGSVLIDENVDLGTLGEVERGLLIGAFIYVGSSPRDVPSRILGSRVRLSFMLAPRRRLLFRNYRAVNLSSALERVDPRQSQLSFEGAEEEPECG